MNRQLGPPYSTNPTQAFLQYLVSVRKRGHQSQGDDPYFIPQSKLEEYFAERSTILAILKHVFGNQSPNPTLAQQIQQRYLRCFAILLVVGASKLIADFVEYPHLADKQLPFHKLPICFPIAENGTDLWTLFYKNQWKFCAPVLEYAPFTVRLERILPFEIMQEISDGDGGTGRTFKIRVHPEYDRLRQNNDASTSSNDGYYALKRYHTSSAGQNCRNEVNNFVSICDDPRNEENGPGVIGFCGGQDHNGQLSIILEYAKEGSLENYYHRNQGHQAPYKFWKRFLPVCTAVERIHNFFRGGDSYEGWHQDIKPGNILAVFSNKEIKFKLGDLGFSRFWKRENGPVRARSSTGTRTYGAPECYEAVHTDSFPFARFVTGKIDVWSLSCVLSEAAVWQTRGLAALKKYRKARREKSDVDGVDCFHNGYEVSGVVTKTHEEVINFCKKYDDRLTPRIIKLVERGLVHHKERLDSQQFSTEMRNILAYFSRQDINEDRQVRLPQAPLPPGPFQAHPRPVGANSPAPSSRPRAGSQNTHNRQPSFAAGTTRQTTNTDPPSTRLDGQFITVQEALRRRDKVHGHILKRNELYDILKDNDSRMKELADRDHVFLVDDAYSMTRHWPSVLDTLTALSYIVKHVGRNGLDLYFMVNKAYVQGAKDSQKLRDSARDASPTKSGQFSNIDQSLGKITQSYQKKLDARHGVVDPMTVYVLTNGIWQTEVGVKDIIKSLARSLEAHHKPPNQFGIQFIQFGDDPTGTARLNYYDHGLSVECAGKRDFVDTVPASGSVWKMLLGPINRTFDAPENKEAVQGQISLH